MPVEKLLFELGQLSAVIQTCPPATDVATVMKTFTLFASNCMKISTAISEML